MAFKLIVPTIVLIGLFLTRTDTRSIDPDIVGGEPTDITHIPFQVAQYHYNSYQCGGTVMSEDGYWILTAAHCLDFSWLQPKDVTFRGGSTSSKSGGVVVEAESWVIHPQYNWRDYDYDVAVVKLASPMVGDNIKSVRLIDETYELKNDEIGTVSGWGRMDNGSLPEVLLKVDIPILLNKECEPIYGEEIYDNMFCAGTPGKDSCNGDSGGPLTVQNESGCTVQAGIVSFGPALCGTHFGVYTKLSHPGIREFIRNQTGI